MRRSSSIPLSEEDESRLIRARNEPGILVELSPGVPGCRALVTIHGIFDSPRSVQPLSARGIADGRHTLTFAYDDRFRRLVDSSRDLADQLSAWWKTNQGTPIQIDAHSMGGRIAVVAIDLLQRSGRLGGEVTLRLIAPPLAGMEFADGASFAPAFLRSLIAGIRPGLDMGPRSEFQRRLERVRFPRSVRTQIFIARRDHVVDATAPRFRAIARNLGADLVVLDGGHTDVIEAVARLPDSDRTARAGAAARAGRPHR